MFKKLNNNAICHLISVMWKHGEGYRLRIVLCTAAAVCAVLLTLMFPLVMSKVMNAIEVQQGDALVATTGKYLLVYMVVSFSFLLVHAPSRVIETVVGYEVRRVMQVSLFRKVTLMPMSWHKSHHSGETIDQVAKASAALGDFAECSFEVTHILVRFFGAIGFLTWIMPRVGLVVLGFALVIGIIIVTFDRVLVKHYATQNKQLNEVAASIQDYLTNVGTVISLRLEERVTREINQRAKKVEAIWRKTSILCELKWFSSSFIVDGMYASVMFGFIFVAVRSGQAVEIGTVYALSSYLHSVADAFFRFTSKYGDLLTKSARVRAVDHIEADYDELVKRSVNATLPEQWKTVDISELCFSHEGEEATQGPNGVRDISFTLERGKSYALVGESGSGKSTVLKLLRGLHTAQTVKVVCDGVVMPDGLSHVAHRATLIPQEPEIFADTIRFNVAMGIEARDAEILWSLERARFAPVLKRLSKGLETNIAEKGVSLSGGEKQRLAVARGLFFVKESESEIVLLDEPTSSVDIYNERLIYQALLKEFRELCVLSAIHKFNLLPLFDEVLVFAHGELVERGSVDELLAKDGEFVRLWRTFSSQEDAQVAGV
jgi:ABC-type multidrug transport system fused ATPase/permease subunit